MLVVVVGNVEVTVLTAVVTLVTSLATGLKTDDFATGKVD